MSGIVVGIVGLALSVSPALPPSSDAQYRIVRRDGPGPHPAVMFVSGCDGFAPSMAPELYERRAEQSRGRGYAVVFADYLGRRGFKSCAGSVTHQDAARDLVAAAAWVTPQTFVDRARITAIGWSFSGRAVLVALAEHGKGHLAFSRAVVYYPDGRALEPFFPFSLCGFYKRLRQRRTKDATEWPEPPEVLLGLLTHGTIEKPFRSNLLSPR